MAAQKRAQECLASGAPRQKWDEMLVAQGANLEAFNHKLALDHTAPVVADFKARKAGFVSRCDARIIGEVIRDLGGGRLSKESVINYDVGVDRLAKPGDRVSVGDTLVRVHAPNQDQAEAACARLKAAFTISPRHVRPGPLARKMVSRA
jgi:thymidine phosphorylase